MIAVSMIKNLFVVCFLCVLFPAVIQAQSSTGDVYVLVRLTDYKGVKTFKSASLEEFRELSHAAKADNDALPEAYDNLRKDWKKTETKVERRTVRYGRQQRQVDVKVPAPPFPLKCPAPREVRQMGTFASMEELDKLKLTLETRETERVEKIIKEKEKKEADADSPQGGLKRPPVKAPANRLKSVSPEKEQELLGKLIQEIEKIQAAAEAAGGNTVKARVGSPAKTSTRPIRRMGQ